MPLLDIATTRPVFQNDVCAVNSQILICNRFKSGKGIGFASLWKSFCVPEKAQSFGGIKLYQGRLMIRAVVTLEKESTKADQTNKNGGGYQSSTRKSIDSGNLTCSVIERQSRIDESTELDEREKLRRARISKANTGNVPWNKGRKHSPETLQKIRERTRIAMQDPKVKMKLVSLGHVQSKETRLKIAAGVRAGWEKRRKMLKLQEACYYEWQHLIADASRKGFLGEEELQWDSYQILDRQLEEVWLHSLKQRKASRGSEGNKRAPKSAEQRRKIAEAIAAKWADPDYRGRVCSSLARYHSTREVVERKPRKRPSSDGQPRKGSPPKKKVDISGVTVRNSRHQIEWARLKKGYTPKYRDPLARSKLAMLKNIRAQRGVADNKKFEAVKRAKLMIAEAEKAAEALETAAMRSPVARASLVETRYLIAEAIRSIDSINLEGMFSGENDGDQLLTSPETANIDDSPNNAETESLDEIGERKLNGVQVLAPSGDDIHDFNFTNNSFNGLLNGNETAVLSSSGDYDLLGSKEELYQAISSDLAPPPVEQGMQASESGDREANEIKEDEHKCDLAPPPVEEGMQASESSDQEADEVEEDEHKSPPNKMTFHPTPLPNGLMSQPKTVDPLANSTTATATRQWVRGRLVEVAEEG